MKKEIHIGKPYVVEKDGMAYLCATVGLHDESVLVQFWAEEIYGKYLVDDRADAFVIGLLATAMRDGTDIVCDAPVTRRLLYQLRHYLIPILADNLSDFHPISLAAEPTDEKLPCEHAVTTSWTGDVDCMFTMMQALKRKESSHRLTHLMIADNGALKENENRQALKVLVQETKKGIARELGLSVIGVGANLQELVHEKFQAVAAYRQAAAVLAMQKLFGVYLSSSSCEFAHYSFDADNSSRYEMSLFPYFETDCTVFYFGGAYSRERKLEALSDFPLAQKFLHSDDNG